MEDLGKKLAESLAKKKDASLAELIGSAMGKAVAEATSTKKRLLEINVDEFLSAIENIDYGPYLFVTKDQVKYGEDFQTVNELFPTVKELTDAGIEDIDANVFENLDEFANEVDIDDTYIDLYAFDEDTEIEWLF